LAVNDSLKQNLELKGCLRIIVIALNLNHPTLAWQQTPIYVQTVFLGKEV